MSNSDFERWVREYNREVERVNRENKRRIDDYNRQVDRENQRRVDEYNRQNQRRVDEYNRQARRHNEEVQRQIEKANRENQRQLDAYNRHVTSVNQHNRQVDASNKAAIADLTRRLNATRYSPQEEQLAERIAGVVAAHDPRQWDVFLSYARIDGSEIGRELRSQLDALGVRVWFDEVAIQPGKSQARQMDQGLAKAHCGIALLTPAYIAGRFWTERELGALLSKNTLIPVLHGVTFDEVKEYSGILPDLAGFETARHSVAEIADKIADAVLRQGSLPGGS
ncbi:toll/interleukin-1 receptor domain-containing protein [Mycobacterium colombiense]|uniref:toll/interleukin-1 receptor domain-containing protein n=1 Tax=Mycobacterium colombiense TaxID=339268 RepID=UPI000A4D8073|nr:toll/interleukin-1 receptor domain-containing protein [Mycobacterium colombiense]